jgi:hypothetical protein
MWFLDPLSDRYPSVIKAILVALGYRLRGRRAPYRIEWKETLWDVAARFVVGLGVGAIVAFLLIPVVFWPGRRGRSRGRSVYDALGNPAWVGFLFLAVLIGTAVIMALRTKARLYHLEEDRTDPPML